jgi:predicted nucleic acid-binding protein
MSSTSNDRENTEQNPFRPLLYNPSTKVLIDTTVLCGAIRSPGGINERILELARTNALFIPVLSKVCLLEFMRNAQEGLGNVVFSYTEVKRYIIGMIDPILDEHPPVNSVVGRYSIETILRENRPIKEVLELLSGYTIQEADELVHQQEMSEPLHHFDQDDFHVWIAAIQTQCDYIVTANSKKFPRRIGNIHRIHPREFYRSMTGE